jgi:D-alanyl-lipoteichoic acid acyltransferase DltB (MBOAT superfamily)
MLFNSREFIIYYIIVTAVFFLLPHRYRWFHLLAASCYFYMTFVPLYILILFGTIILDYYAGIWIEEAEDNESRQRFVLISSVVINILVLGVFKYYNFFIENVNGFGAGLPLLNIILPIGLSFHTFQALAYLFEVYRGNQTAERHFGIYSLYVMFYPQLVAGPIERPQRVLPQFKVEHKFSWELFWSGLRLIMWGFFKKVVVADRLSVYVDIIYAQPMAYTNFANVLLAFVFFLVQVYCDFSGYSDIALGTARTMGFNLMVNFNRPLESRSISEFWRRWHISLSTWFNDYLFTAVSASARRLRRKGIILAVIITFALSGLWHGAAWTFVIFGLIHGICIVYEMLTKDFRTKISRRLPPRVWGLFCWFVTISVVILAVVFFRASSFGQAVEMLKYVLTFKHDVPFQTVVAAGDKEFGITAMLLSFIVIAITFIVEHFTSPLLLELDIKPRNDIAFCTTMLVLIVCLGMFQKNTFIYFQF